MIVKDDSFSIADKKLQAIQELPIPKTYNNFRSQLALFQYYKKFIPFFNDIACVMGKLMKKNVPFLWTQEHTGAHNLLKALFQENLSPRIPNPNLPYVIHTDASCHATSAVLHQREGEELFPIAFHSQTLTETQLQHSILDKELFALVDSIKCYEFYVSGTNFQVYTDLKVLFYLREAKESNAKLYRYRLLLKGYDFTITHLKSSENLVADALSRVCSSNMEERAKEVNRAKKDILDKIRGKVKEMSVPDGTKFDGKIISTLLKQLTVPDDVLTSIIDHNFLKECRKTDFPEEIHISLIESNQEEDEASRNIQREILAATSLQAGNMDIEASAKNPTYIKDKHKCSQEQAKNT